MVYRIVEVSGLKQAGDFEHLYNLIAKNPGCTEGVVNGKFLPFPRRYKNKKFLVVLGTGRVIEAKINNSRSGFKWLDEKGNNLNGRVMAWREN